jgi:hypothetical protein
MRDWRSEAGIRGGAKLLARQKLSEQQNGTTTPLGGRVPPQKTQEKRPDATNNRPDGFRPVAPQSPLDAAQKPCARKACGRWFTPTRPNQAYCPNGDCRQRALDERKVEGLTSVLEELAAAPSRPYRSHDEIWARLLELADRAAAALDNHRNKK